MPLPSVPLSYGPQSKTPDQRLLRRAPRLHVNLIRLGLSHSVPEMYRVRIKGKTRLQQYAFAALRSCGSFPATISASGPRGPSRQRPMAYQCLPHPPLEACSPPPLFSRPRPDHLCPMPRRKTARRIQQGPTPAPPRLKACPTARWRVVHPTTHASPGHGRHCRRSCSLRQQRRIIMRSPCLPRWRHPGSSRASAGTPC